MFKKILSSYLFVCMLSTMMLPSVMNTFHYTAEYELELHKALLYFSYDEDESISIEDEDILFTLEFEVENYDDTYDTMETSYHVAILDDYDHSSYIYPAGPISSLVFISTPKDLLPPTPPPA